MKYREYDDETLKHMQKVLMMVLKDVIAACDKNNLDYYIYAGSAIGAVRHNGFIPWDDDVDIIMFRKDYIRFSQIFDDELGEKYSLQMPEDIFLNFSKVKLNGTKYEIPLANRSFDTGICLDIFILDNVPSNRLKQKIFTSECYIKRILKDVSFLRSHDSSKLKQSVMDIINVFLKIFNLDYNKLKNSCLQTYIRYLDDECEFVADLEGNGHFKPHVFSRSDFEPAGKSGFGDIEVKVPNNIDGVLTQIYGDYMKMPPKEERYNHEIINVDFGDY